MPAQPVSDPVSPEPTDDIFPAEARARLSPQLLNRRVDVDGGSWTEDILAEEDDDIGHPPGRHGWARLRHPLVLLVLVPTLIAAAFEYVVAADQFESEASFIVRTPQPNTPASGLSQMLGMSTGPMPADAHSVSEYLLSHDAVDALGRNRLVAIFRRPEADPATRLWFAAPQPETLLRYYRGKVSITNVSETGITSLRVLSYRREDSKQLADELLKLGEVRVNSLNQRMLEDGLKVADRQIQEAEALVTQTQRQLTSFRQSRRDIDPEKTSAAQISMAMALQQQAAQARANFEAMAATIPPSAPQYAATERQVRALERQVGAAQARLTGSERSVAAGLGDYEQLQLEQEFAAKRYEAASASFQAAREQLLKQQLFIVPLVKPNLPGKALYPKRLETVATIFFGLLFAYAIGWLILAGVREHSE